MGKSHDYSFLSLPDGFLPLQDMGSTVEIDIHLTVQLAKVRATPFIGYQYQSTRMLSIAAV